MKVRFHKNFEKQYKKLSKVKQAKARERLLLFLDDPFNPKFSNHPLRGKYADYRSINITGDLRAVYKFINEKECIFVVIGSHSKLYS